jgi:hypothetical protein
MGGGDVTLTSDPGVGRSNLSLIVEPDTQVQVSGAATITLGDVQIASSGQLDIGFANVFANGDAGAWNGSAYDGYSGLIQRRRIVSNAVVGIAAIGGGVQMRATFAGDSNLDGIINGDDYFNIDAGFNAQAHGYAMGDFDYNGKVNADDYFLIDSNYNKGQSPLEGAVPFRLSGAELAGSAIPLARGSAEENPSAWDVLFAPSEDLALL